MCTIIPSNVIDKGVLRESYIDNASIDSLKMAGITPSAIPNTISTIKLIIFNKAFSGVGVRNNNRGLEFYCPQLNAMLQQEALNTPLFPTGKPQPRINSNPLPSPDEDIEKLLSIFEDEPQPENQMLNAPVTLKHPGLCHFPKRKNLKTKECCLFVDFMSFLCYQSRLRYHKDPNMIDCDCIILNNPCNFPEFIIDSENYEKAYCIFPSDNIGKTLLLTLKARRAPCVVDFSKYYNAAPALDTPSSSQDSNNQTFNTK